MDGLAYKLRAFCSAFIIFTTLCFSPTGNALVISQIYGGGGNTASLFTHDFIELFNNSTSVADLSGFSVQYASSSGKTWHETDLSGTLDPFHYYLIQESGGSNGTSALPTPDKTDTISLSAYSGNIALVSSQTALTGPSDCLSASILDLVGYGSAVCYEGGAAVSRLSNTKSAARLDGGLTNSNDNALDFELLLPPMPRNTLSAANITVANDPGPVVNSVDEPTSLLLLGGGLAILGFCQRRRQYATASTT